LDELVINFQIANPIEREKKATEMKVSSILKCLNNKKKENHARNYWQTKLKTFTRKNNKARTQSAGKFAIIYLIQLYTVGMEIKLNCLFLN